MTADLQRQPDPAFPLGRAVLCLTAAALPVYALAAWAVPAAFGHPPGALRAVTVMAVVVWASALAAVVPVSLLGPRGLMPAVWAYFGGAALRIVICLVAAVACVLAARLPAACVAVSLVAVYLPLLFIEAGMVGRYVWLKDRLHAERAAAAGGTARAQAPAAAPMAQGATT